MSLEETLALILAAHAQTIAVAFHDLQSNQRVELRAREPMHAASTMKLAVLLAAQKADPGEPILVQNRFVSIADGSSFAVDAKDDDDPWPYTKLGQRVPLRVLLERMIVRSSNLATNLVMQRVPAEQVMQTCAALGATDMRILRGVEDLKAHEKGLDNLGTAHDLALLLEAISARPALVELLARQEFNEGIPAGLPKGVRVAHKTGDITAHYHDAALVYPKGRRPYALVVMTKGFESKEQGAAAVREISQAVWRSVVDLAR